MTMGPMGQLAEASSKAEVRFGTTQPQRRVTVAFRLILVIPQAIVLGFVGIGAFFVAIVGWFAALFTGRLPESMANFLLGYVRWSARFSAYLYLMDDVYPPFTLDPDPSYPVDVAVTTGRLNRAAVFFRIILAFPVWIFSTILSYGMGIFSIISWIATLIVGSLPDAIFGASAAVIRFQTRTNAYFLMLTSEYPSDVMGDKDPWGNNAVTTVSGTVGAAPIAPAPYSQPPYGRLTVRRRRGARSLRVPRLLSRHPLPLPVRTRRPRIPALRPRHPLPVRTRRPRPRCRTPATRSRFVPGLNGPRSPTSATAPRFVPGGPVPRRHAPATTSRCRAPAATHGPHRAPGRRHHP